MAADILFSPFVARAVVLGAFGGIGLVLTSTYSRRGPLIFPVYAVLLCGLALLLTRFDNVSFFVRFYTAFVGFVIAGGIHYVAICVLAARERRRLGFNQGVPFFGHVWRVSALLGIGALVCAGVAFVVC